MATKTTLVTYDDYRNLPDDGKRYEIIEGRLLMTPAPHTIHQRILGKLYKSISNYTEEQNIGEIFIAPVDVILSMTNVVQPDLMFIAKERSHIITEKNVVAAPDLVAEITSESTKVRDQTTKKALYEKYGVKEYWIIYPDDEKVEQFILQDEKLVLQKTVGKSDLLKPKVISGLSIALEEVFTR